ncbi:unnamed protein product, partial [Adineta ricciae]
MTERSDSNTKRVRIESDSVKKNRSASASRHSLVDETERQMEMQLLDSPPSRKKSKQ